MSILREFKEFALRGNVLDLAVAFIMGAAFATITNSLVNDILMPPVGLLLGGADFSKLFINLGPGEYATLAAANVAGAPTLNYGNFINTIVNFVIVAAAMFVVVKQMNWLQRINASPDTPAALPETKNCPYCVSVIPLAASRCPQCTSGLDGDDAAAVS